MPNRDKGGIARYKAQRNSKKQQAPKEPKAVQPIALKIPKNLMPRIISTANLRNQHLQQVQQYQQAADDNLRAINNLVVGYLSGLDDIQVENYTVDLTDDFQMIILTPKPVETVAENAPVTTENAEEVAGELNPGDTQVSPTDGVETEGEG